MKNNDSIKNGTSETSKDREEKVLTIDEVAHIYSVLYSHFDADSYEDTLAEAFEEESQYNNLKKMLAVDDLSQFSGLGLKRRIYLEPGPMKGVSIKLSDKDHQLISTLAVAMSQSKSKIMQELVSGYIESAYASYLKGLYFDDASQEVNLESLKIHLQKDTEYFGSSDIGFNIRMLSKMGFVGEVIQIIETMGRANNE